MCNVKKNQVINETTCTNVTLHTYLHSVWRCQLPLTWHTRLSSTVTLPYLTACHVQRWVQDVTKGLALHSYTNLKCFIHGVNLFILFLFISKNIIAFSILLAIRLIVLCPCFICTLHLCFTRLEKRGTVEKAQRHFPLQSNRFSDKLTV